MLSWCRDPSGDVRRDLETAEVVSGDMPIVELIFLTFVELSVPV